MNVREMNRELVRAWTCTACKHLLDVHDCGWCFSCVTDAPCAHKPRKRRAKKAEA